MLKRNSIELEKENNALQSNIDKVTRMLGKASTDSIRYKSVVDLQK